MAAELDDLTKLGYTVSLVRPAADGDAPVYFVSGFGVSVYLTEADGEIIDSLAAGPPVDQPPPPSLPASADAVLGALTALDPATASLEDVVNAVKAALLASGAEPP